MPPLLAALFMIEFSCDLRIVQAIDLCVEWRQYEMYTTCAHPSTNWYAGWLGVAEHDQPYQITRGTYAWPSHVCDRRYAPQ